MTKSTFAYCGTAFFLMFAYIIATHGPIFICWALLAGGASQFAAQDDHPYARAVSIALAYVAFLLCAIAAVGL